MQTTQTQLQAIAPCHFTQTHEAPSSKKPRTADNACSEEMDCFDWSDCSGGADTDRALPNPLLRQWDEDAEDRQHSPSPQSASDFGRKYPSVSPVVACQCSTRCRGHLFLPIRDVLLGN
jgi:hypothetical protein